MDTPNPGTFPPGDAALSSEVDIAAARAWFLSYDRLDMDISLEWDWDLLTSAALEKELELTPEQKERVNDLRARFRLEEELWRTHSLLKSEVDRKLEELRDRYRALIRRELSSEQQREYDALDAGSEWNRIKSRGPGRE